MSWADQDAVVAVCVLWRTRTGKAVIVTTGLLALLGMIFLYTLSMFVVRVNQMQASYEAKLRAVSASMNGKILPVYGLSFTEREILHTLTESYMSLIDSLELSDQVHGYRLHYNLFPPDLLEAPSSQIDFFLDCGCEQAGVYDVLTLNVDPATLLPSASPVRKRITIDEYQLMTPVERR